MRKKWLISAISILGMVIAFCYVLFVFFSEPFAKEEFNKNNDRYFVILPIEKWTDDVFPTPCISMRIGDMTISSMIDLGFCGQFSIASNVLAQIDEKKYLGSSKRYEYNGKEFEKKVFEIPLIKTNGVTFYEARVLEEIVDPTRNSCIYTENESPSPKEPGKIGWEAFGNFNLFLDLGNEILAVCDSFETLENEGYPIESFISTPLILDRGLIEIDSIIHSGLVRCALDTGCTVNSINAPELMGQTKFDMENITKFSKFKIAEKDFGPIKFLRLPIKLPIHVECVLGMEFFNDNMVFLDFKNNVAYFAPSTKNLSSSLNE